MESTPGFAAAARDEAAGDESSFDERLQRSRRLDWRFLQPDPALGRVVAIGSVDSELRAALETFASELDLVERAASIESPESVRARVAAAEVVVACAPDALALELVIGSLSGGSRLHLELEPRSGLGARIGRAASARVADRLRRAGFVDIRRHWHWPDFGRCRVMLDVDEPAALAHFFRGRAPGAAGRALASAARVAGALGLIDRVAAYTSVSALRSEP